MPSSFAALLIAFLSAFVDALLLDAAVAVAVAVAVVAAVEFEFTLEFGFVAVVAVKIEGGSS
jgi:hypothetical protein